MDRRGRGRIQISVELPLIYAIGATRRASVVHFPTATGQSGTLSTHIGTRVHCAVSSANLRPGVGARRVTEPTAKFSCEMRVVAKAAGVSDGAYQRRRHLLIHFTRAHKLHDLL